MKKVLVVGAENFGAGGRSVIAYNLVENIGNDYAIDFLSIGQVRNRAYYEKISRLNGQIVVCDELKSSNKFLKLIDRTKKLIKIYSDRGYDIIHIHADDSWDASKSVFVAKMAGYHNIIVHGHTAKENDRFFRKVLNFLTASYVKKNALVKLACSQKAGEYLFGKNEIFTILKNGIFTDRYIFSEKTRKLVRNKLMISEEEIVIGTIGRISEQKNPYFLVDIYEKLFQMNSNFKLIWIGDGELREEVEQYANNKGLSSNILWLGNREDVPELLQGLDVFILTSNYEGFGIVAIEAQAADLLCIISDAVPEEAKVTNDFYFMSTQQSEKEWAKHINSVFSYKKVRSNKAREIVEAGYDITQSTKQLRKIYEEFI